VTRFGIKKVSDEPARDDEMKDDADEDDEQRRFHREPPEALPLRLEQRDSVGL